MEKQQKLMLAGEVRGWFLISPYLLYTLVFFILPLVQGVYIAFTNWDLVSTGKEFIGLGNFFKAFGSKKVIAAFFATYKFMAIFLAAVIPISLGIALLVNSFPSRFKGLISVAFFLPFLVSPVATSLVVRGVLNYTSPLNRLLHQVLGYVPNWLGHPILAVIVIGLMITWKCSGYYALIFFCGLQTIPKELYEAADIDGAGNQKKFWNITIPMLYPAFYTVMIMAVGLMFHIFSEPYMLTDGGPKLSTYTWFLEIYYQSFTNAKVGYGSTVAILNAITTFITIILVRKLLERWGKAYGWE